MRISIEIEEYNSLREDSLFLECLEAAGVNNWDGYDEAKQIQREAIGNPNG